MSLLTVRSLCGLRRWEVTAMQIRSLMMCSAGGSGGWRKFGAKGWNVSALPFAAAAAAGSAALCENSEQKQEKEQGNELIDFLGPIAQQVTLGSVMGYSAGYALRVVGRFAAFGVGMMFMSIQGAAYMGYIDINWKNIANDSMKLIDADGDGNFDTKDVKIMIHKFLEVCTYQLPSSTGFTAGLALGLGFGGATAGKFAATVSAATLIPRVLMAGTAATAGTGAMVAAKDHYDRERSTTSSLIQMMSERSKVSPVERFSQNIKSMGLDALRDAEKDLKKQIKELSDEEAKARLLDRIAKIEDMKKQLKKDA